MTKRMLNQSFEQSFEQALDDEARSQTVNFGTRDTVEAISAFVEKRAPHLQGTLTPTASSHPVPTMR